MEIEEIINTMEIAIAEVEWNYPLSYAIAFEEAIGILKKHIPMKPVGARAQKKCPVCGCRVRSGEGSSSRTKDIVCRKCFQVFDWRNDES